MRNMKEVNGYLASLSHSDLLKAAQIMAFRLIECEEISYRGPGIEDSECLYWDGNGESILT